MKEKKKKQRGKSDDESGNKKVKTKIGKKRSDQPEKKAAKIYTSADNRCKQRFIST